MFSGIVRNTGEVVNFESSSSGARLTISSRLFAEGAVLGESIAVDGVCLTVVAVDVTKTQAVFDLATETLRCTTFSQLNSTAAGRCVVINLERSLRFGDPVDGHFVQGHVDAVAELLSREEQGGNTIKLIFRLPAILAWGFSPKGSVAINGVSLTVGEVSDESFSVYIIPHTLAETNLRELSPGMFVNIEVDCLARYVRQALKAAKLEKMSEISEKNR